MLVDGKSFIKNRYYCRNFIYFNENGDVVIEVRFWDNVFNYVVEISMYEDEFLFLVLCLEMLIKLVWE